MRVLLVGSGGREHALAWRLTRAGGVELHAAPGSPGIAALGECHPIRAEDAEGLLGLAHSLDVDLVVADADDPVTERLDVVRANRIGLLTAVVNRTVNLDGKAVFRTAEIQHIAAKRTLPAEFRVPELIPTQCLPKLRLRRCHGLP